MTGDTSGKGQIVLVEDDPTVRGVIALLLQADGWEVVEAADGRVGLTIVTEVEPDLLVTDLRLPGLSGIELARRIVRRPGLDHLPMIAITSDAERLYETAVESGRFFRVLNKPLEPGAFLEAVRGGATVR